ncbi:receptor-type tyrosine-protein phosphatase zeta isoform X2 [Linepithema humile]|uniref:receptor-type tyrosine-protein phosphatase zeta isoform X2 n=1 Tax=Linepithema humile TaxID=83485 RepID=UPI0006232D58|nr:PREDICTED: receptor-type tyrosine-protein phosphatase zeta isoform X1 [Linepithema humile]XP_012227880.1 PREDICTED: receptor-type tyrosine-protein phosphatase zeta isoform X2 [Linepithema humile]XP_012227881.1 PREDICTED: receptor-type tyrosine-protein phosphatase zeta isoform X1 [Linepithema humile]XP_012227882.1 PREDICTED: receptor-type tyrosine-protein phosphatase zeta isoform X3 [Linepithema humile]
MTRRRTSILILGVCIGFLFYGNVIAEVTEASTVASEKSDFHKALTPQGTSTTIATSIPSIHQNQSIVEKDERNIDLTSRKAHEREDESRDSGDESASQDGEKGNVSRSASDTTLGANSHEESESSSSDDGSRRVKYGEIAAESSGKSTSTKAVSEDPLRLFRTNELTIATAKPALNDSKQDNKKNLEDATLQESSDHEGMSDTTKSIPITNEKVINAKLTANIMKISEPKYVIEESLTKREERKNMTVNKEITTVKSIGDFSLTSSTPSLEDAEKKDKITKFDFKEVASKSESRKDKNATSADLKENMEDHKLENRDRELTTPRGIQYEDPPETKRDANDLGTTASEALDLGKIDGKGHEGTISLINDTYVNYNHFYKTLTEKEPKAGSSNHSGDPKKEVEVVENVTHQPILRIVTATNDTAKNDSHFNELNNREQKIDAKDENRREQRVDSSVINATLTSAGGGAEERKSIGEPESQVKLPETTTRSVRLEEHTSPISPEATPSPVPQGRTIGFSGVNEFPNIEVKSTTKADGGSEASSVIQSSRNNSSAEKIDQRPYPYLKSSKQPFQVTTEASLKPGVTEETSAYENTIGKGESEKKFIVTEPSVVIENSIQQQKSDKRNIKESRNSTTGNPSSLTAATAVPIVSVGPTNKTYPQKFNGTAFAAVIKESNKNNASNTKEKEKVIASSEAYDVTGNGITEVSLTQNGKQVKSHSSEATNASTSRSTEMPKTPKTVALNTDIQTEPEGAMMIRSTLVVTESTMVPVDGDVAKETNKSTISTTLAAEVKSSMNATIILENSTKPTPKANVTQQSSSANQTSKSPSVTLNPDESSIPTTTSVEFEFVSLTEAVSSGNNATERTVERQTMPSKTTHDSATANNSTGNVTTIKPENFSELPTTIENGTPTTDRATVYRASNETTVADSPITSTAPAEQTNRTDFTGNEVTMSVIDFTTADNAGASGITEDSAEPKDSSFDVNITETSAPGATELLPSSGITTMPSTTNATRSPSTPFATSTPKPNIFWSTPSFTDSSEEEITESVQTLSSDEITLLVKIVIEGTLHEVCPRLQDLRKAIADALAKSIGKRVLPKQIVVHQNPCLESSNSSPTPTDTSLTTILVYVVDGDGKFDAAMTKILPSLHKVSPNFPVRIHKFLLIPEADSGNAIAVVVVSSVAFICLVLLAGLLFIMRKRQTRFNYGERCRPVSLDAYSLDSVSAYNSVRRKGAARSSKRSYGNPTFEDSSAIPSHPLNFAGLSSFCNDVNAINEEYAGIPQVSAKIDELPPGAEVKNRYANVIPLPETRVPLQKLNNDALTEYINASYVRGPKNATKYYIACQAPIESTVTDFWRMIWEQQSKVIIMLTDLVENEVEKCTEYIPPSEVTDCHRLYGDFQVTLKKRETKEKYAISTLHLKNLENNTYREVFHIWYLWPVSGVQSDGTGLIAVLLEARALQRGGPGPIVVHCSPGTGRTGTLIALDLGIRQYEITRTVDVPRVVYTIRRDRAGAVQTKEQYAFIYKALNLYATKLAGGVLEST